MNGILGMYFLSSFTFSELTGFFIYKGYSGCYTIVCIISGMLALLLDTDLSSTQKDYAQTAQACGKALIQLINEVLDRAKIEAGKLELEAVLFDIRSILDDVLSLFSEKSRQKGLEVGHIDIIPFLN